jgi:hypothetical protein
MHRSAYLVLVLTTLATPVRSSASSSVPVIRFSFYAPAQRESPVRIVRLEHDESEVRFVLSNASEKAVFAVVITHVDIVPRECTIGPWSEPYRAVKNFGATGFRVNIKPRDQGIADRAGIIMVGTHATPRYPHYPKSVVNMAKHTHAAHIQVQLGVTGVVFADGTAWPPEIAEFLRNGVDLPDDASVPEVTGTSVDLVFHHSSPFDPSLVDADTGNCSDVTSAVDALELVTDVVFEHESQQISNRDPIAGALPHLDFNCRLEGSKALCRLPLEAGSSK